MILLTFDEAAHFLRASRYNLLFELTGQFVISTQARLSRKDSLEQIPAPVILHRVVAQLALLQA
jgi:hypothetical protein